MKKYNHLFRHAQGIIIPRQIFLAEDIGPAEKVLFSILDHLCCGEEWLQVSNMALAEICGVSISTIKRQILSLLRGKYVLTNERKNKHRLVRINCAKTILDDYRKDRVCIIDELTGQSIGMSLEEFEKMIENKSAHQDPIYSWITDDPVGFSDEPVDWKNETAKVEPPGESAQNGKNSEILLVQNEPLPGGARVLSPLGPLGPIRSSTFFVANAGDSQPIEKKKKFEENSVQYLLAQLLFHWIQENNSSAKEPNLQAWALEIDKMMRIDKRTPEEIERVIDFCQKDSFWCSNILSVVKLRKQFDQLMLKSGGARRKRSVSEKDSHPNLTLTIKQRFASVFLKNKNAEFPDSQLECFIECSEKVYQCIRKSKMKDKEAGELNLVKSLCRCLMNEYSKQGKIVYPRMMCSDHTWNILLPQHIENNSPALASLIF
jgi:hypothetical protein